MFGMINIIGNFGTVFVDNSYWLSAIVARPSAAAKGYLLSGICCFSIPFSLATSLGLTAAALMLPITSTETAEGLVPQFGVSIVNSTVRVPSYITSYHLHCTNRIPPTMGILSLCADSACPPGLTMPPPSPSDHQTTMTSLHFISDLSCSHSTPSQPPTGPPPIHNRFFTQATLWFQMTLQSKALLPVFLLLGLIISWIPLTVFLFSTLCISICLTAEELATTVEEMDYNWTWTTRKQQQQHQERIPEAPTHASSQQHLHPVTGLHDISTFTRALRLPAKQLP
jgi:hypothetical protein